jgi:hypothetical protein
LFQRYKDRAAFLFVYIQEAHPADGWQMESNESEGVIFNQPKDWGERQAVAKACSVKLNLSMPCVVDTIDNTMDNLYAAWPERMFVIDRDGKVAYAGKQGPWGFKPKQAERALRVVLQRKFKERPRNGAMSQDRGQPVLLRLGTSRPQPCSWRASMIAKSCIGTMNQQGPERGQPCPRIVFRGFARTWLSALRETSSWRALLAKNRLPLPAGMRRQFDPTFNARG